MLDFFFDPENWSGGNGIPMRTLAHLAYTFIALGIAAAIAVPLGILIGVTGRGEALIAGLANALRALPTLGLLILIVMLVAPLISSSLAFTIPAIIVLVLLAVPPILTGTYSGIQNADRNAVQAARGMGYTTGQILWRVQVPMALPLIMSGLRGALLQVVSTATVAAFVSLGGLGRYIIDGRATQDYPQMLAGALLVAVLALALELLFMLLERFVVSPGLQRKTTSGAALATA
ncbi:ABC transporter permease [Agrococcus casei]|uniref:Glycine betaine ABC transport system permease protein n=1 Tax=Agrococcus casei LMG 22410 TaxID=1255656 RepID=A0A1R4FAS0_9MICO|nr:ABC transporter permease subunit [Agrococcus casei]SJM52931.1 Glycine betaine ABC transport system permease protein [Agrococcus casei LMG 22410]